jgi:predicted O-methyltransferase YrrM
MYGLVKHLVAPLLLRRGWTSACEIGASHGASTDVLASLPNLALTVVDPCLDCNLEQKYADHERVTVRKGTSLEILPRLESPFDCILIDGDHNWYTVYNELRVIFERNLLRQGGMVFFHDVDWPYARQDMYYQPQLIPAEYRHACERKGIARNQIELSESNEYNSTYWNAAHEGGPKNGVLTAIEDFVREHGDEYRFFHMRGQHGLGIMCRRYGLRDDFALFRVKWTCTTYKIITPLKKFTWTYFPSFFYAAKSLLGVRSDAP